MKKIITIVLAIALIATMLTGCSAGNTNNGANGQTNNGQTNGQANGQANDNNTNKNELKEGSDLKEIVDKINSDIGIAMSSDIDDALLADMYGIKKDDIDEYAGKMSMIMNSSDTFIIVKAKEGKAENVKKALEARRETIIQGQYLPAEIEKANAGKVITVGNYVALMVLGDTNVPEGEDFDSAKAQEEITKAEDIVNSFFNK